MRNKHFIKVISRLMILWLVSSMLASCSTVTPLALDAFVETETNIESKTHNEIETETEIETQTKTKTKTNEKSNFISKARTKKFNSKIPILMYHHISENPALWGSATITPAKFREDMLYLKALGYEGIHFRDYLDYIENGTELPEHPIIITFDDGYLSNYQYAYPVLKELNMKATIAVIGWSRGRSHHLDGVTKIKAHFSWEQAKEMYASGLVDIQHHTYDLHHAGDDIYYGKGVDQMTEEDPQDYKERLATDTTKLLEVMKTEMGHDVNVFVYPFGVYNEISEEILKELGFKVTLTTKDGVSDFSQGLYLLKRINMSGEVDSPDLMKHILKKHKRKADIPFVRIKDQNVRIKKLEELLHHKENSTD